jgi:hypothetical protein
LVYLGKEQAVTSSHATIFSTSIIGKYLLFHRQIHLQEKESSKGRK